MKILLTGSRGFIGRHAYSHFSKENSVCAVNKGDQIPSGKFDLVIHLGADLSTTSSNVDNIMSTNYDYSASLLKRCQYSKTPMIYASSASVYGSTTEFKEVSECHPASPYAWSKYLFDRHVSKQYLGNAPVAGLRFFNVYGNGEDEDHKGFQASVFNKFPKEALATKQIQLFENSKDTFRDFIHVSDIINIIEKFIKVQKRGIWNVGTGKAYSFQDVGAAFAEKYNVPITEIKMPDALKNQYQYFTESNNTKLLKTIGDYEFINPIEWIKKNG